MLNEQHEKKKVIGSILGKLAKTFRRAKRDFESTLEVGEETHIQTHIPSTTSVISATSSSEALSLSRLIVSALLSLIDIYQIQMRHALLAVLKCSGITIYAHTFASLSLAGPMQARQPSLRRFVV